MTELNTCSSRHFSLKKVAAIATCVATGLTWLAGFGSACTPAEPAKPAKRANTTRVERLYDSRCEAALIEGRLFLRGLVESGDEIARQLISIRLDDDQREVHLESGVVDFDDSAGDIRVLHAPTDHHLLLWRWNRGAFTELGRFKLHHEHGLGLAQNAGSLYVLTTRAVRTLPAGSRAWQVLPLKRQLGLGSEMVVAAPRAGGSLYWGFERGEFGGGLERIDLATGAVVNIDLPQPNVSDAIADPRHPECVVIATGLVHMGGSRGQVLRVCGDRTHSIFEKEQARSNPKYPLSEPFYDVAPGADGAFWAATPEHVYRFASERPEEFAIPKVLEQLGGIPLTRKIPEVIVLATGVHRIFPRGGRAPLVIPLADQAGVGGTR